MDKQTWGSDDGLEEEREYVNGLDMESEPDPSPESGVPEGSFFDKFSSSVKKVGKDIYREIGSVGDRFKYAVGKFIKDNSPIAKKTRRELIQMLPYATPEQTHKIALRLMSDLTALKSLKIQDVMPYLSKSDADDMTVCMLKAGREGKILKDALPYISDGCLELILEKYSGGEFGDLELASVYPKLTSRQLGEILQTLLSGRDKNEYNE